MMSHIRNEAISRPDFSICIPTHNRAGLLPALFARLSELSGSSFEVVVVDDGSTDGTREQLPALAAAAPFPVSAIHVANAGRGAALNRAFDAARGRFIFIMDDDDEIPQGVLSEILTIWNGIPAEERKHFCGVCGLAATPEDKIIGQRFAADIEDSDFFRMRIIRGIRGDKREVFLREVLNGYRFPEIEDEKRVSTNLLWFHLAARYKARFVNRVFLLKTYRPDGITASGLKNKVSSARMTLHYYSETLRLFPAMPVRALAQFSSNYFRYAKHSGESVLQSVRRFPARRLGLAFLPIGRIVAAIDSMKLSRAR